MKRKAFHMIAFNMGGWGV